MVKKDALTSNKYYKYLKSLRISDPSLYLRSFSPWDMKKTEQASVFLPVFDFFLRAFGGWLEVS